MVPIENAGNNVKVQGSLIVLANRTEVRKDNANDFVQDKCTYNAPPLSISTTSASLRVRESSGISMRTPDRTLSTPVRRAPSTTADPTTNRTFSQRRPGPPSRAVSRTSSRTPYQPPNRNPSQASAQTLTHTTTNQPTQNSGERQIRADRLRCFLIFCLCIDYSLLPSCPGTLSPEDFGHFTALARRCYDIYIQRRPFAPAPLLDLDEWIEEYDHVIATELRLPASDLGIPSGIVVAMLRTFVSSIRWRKPGYRSVFGEALRNRITERRLARKVVADRTIVIERVCVGQGLQALKRRLHFRVNEVEKELRSDGAAGSTLEDMDKGPSNRAGFSLGGIVERVLVGKEMEFAESVGQAMLAATGIDGVQLEANRGSVGTWNVFGRTGGREHDLLGRRK